MAQSLFTTQTPDLNNQSDGSPGITRGVTLKFAKAGTVTHIRWWCPGTTSGVQTVAVWEVTTGGGSVLLTSKIHSGTPSANGWNNTALDSAITIDPLKVYRFGIHNSEGRYVATSGTFNSGLTNGDIYAYADGESIPAFATIRQGVFTIDAALQFPTSWFGAANYFVDVVFDTGGGTESGSSAVTLPALQAAVTGSASATGTVAAGLSAPQAAGSGMAAATGVITSVLPALRAAATGRPISEVTVPGVLVPALADAVTLTPALTP